MPPTGLNLRLCGKEAMLLFSFRSRHIYQNAYKLEVHALAGIQMYFTILSRLELSQSVFFIYLQAGMSND